MLLMDFLVGQIL